MKQLLYYLKSNKGSGIVTVMLAVLFLTAFGTLALYLSYTSLKVSYAERSGMEAEINAYTCMDEVRAGIQQLTSDAISDTYSEVMPKYTQQNQNIVNAFKINFSNVFAETNYQFTTETEVTSINASGVEETTTKREKIIDEPLFTGVSTNLDGIKIPSGFNISTLEEMVRENRGCSFEITSLDNNGAATNSIGVVDVKTEKVKSGNDEITVPTEYTLKDITLEFTSKDGRKSSVTTDIIIDTPNVGYLLTQYALKGIPSFAMVAKDKIIQDVADKTVTVYNGGVYAGNVELSNNSTFKIQSYSTFICKDTISINGNNAKLTQKTTTFANGNSYKTYNFNTSPRIESDQSSTIWAGNIKLGSMTSAAFYGTTYFKNNFEFAGVNSTVKVGQYQRNTRNRMGSLYGFGSNANSSEGSSTIIVNRESNRLEISELGSLTISGYSFISDHISSSGVTRTNSSNESTERRMGESLSSIDNQLLYYAKAGKVYRIDCETVEDSDGNLYKVNSTGHYIDDSDGQIKYFIFGTDSEGNTDKSKKIYLESDEVYSPKVPTSSSDYIQILDEKISSPITKTDINITATYILVGEETNTYKWEDGEYVIDTPNENGGYSTELIDDTLTEESFKNTGIDVDDTLYGKTFADYHAHIVPIYEPLGGNDYVVHYLLDFATPEDSNAYFVAAFNTNREEIIKTMTTYLNITGLDSSIANTASGSIYTDSSYSSIRVGLTQSIEEIRKNAEFIAEIFDNYCIMLSNEEPDENETADNPFDTYIKRDEIEKVSDFPLDTPIEFKNSSDKVVAIIVNGDYTFDNSKPETICIIIATGDVTVNRNYSGLILTYGSIIITDNAKFTSSSDAVISAFRASGTVNGQTKYIKDYFKRNITKDYTLENGSSVENIAAYDIGEMVYYSNWRE